MNDKRIFDALDSLGVAYERLEHEPIMTMEEGENIAARLGVEATKNLFLVNRQGEHFLLLLRGDKKLRAKDIARQIGSGHLSFATADDMERLLHTQPGAASVLSLLFDEERQVRLLIDKDVLAQEYIGCHPCVNTCSLRMRTSDLLGVFLTATGHKDYMVIETN